MKRLKKNKNETITTKKKRKKILGNKKLRTHEVTKATPATQLMPAQRPRRRRDKIVGGADH
jgi:hypothetical protein